MEIHVVVALTVRRGLEVSGATALDLDAAAGLVLNVLHVRATRADDLGSDVESWHRFKVDGDLLIRPLALQELGLPPHKSLDLPDQARHVQRVVPRRAVGSAAHRPVGGVPVV